MHGDICVYSVGRALWTELASGLLDVSERRSHLLARTNSRTPTRPPKTSSGGGGGQKLKQKQKQKVAGKPVTGRHASQSSREKRAPGVSMTPRHPSL